MHNDIIMVQANHTLYATNASTHISIVVLVKKHIICFESNYLLIMYVYNKVSLLY